MKVNIENILDTLDSIGMVELTSDLSDFPCPLNPEIEDFIHNNAIDFAKRKISITYLVSDLTDGEILGYFTLTHKALDISGKGLSNISRKNLADIQDLSQTWTSTLSQHF